MNYDNLLKYSSFFLKEAGLLKVPENFLKEIQDWATSAYFTKVLFLLHKEVKLKKDRNRWGNDIEFMINQPDYKAFRTAVDYTKDISPIIEYIKSTGDWFRFSLGKFSKDIDKQTKLLGTHD